MDWKKLISELSEHGISQAEIAKACECGQSTISEISLGIIKNPRFSIGSGLVSLHERICLSSKKAA